MRMRLDQFGAKSLSNVACRFHPDDLQRLHEALIEIGVDAAVASFCVRNNNRKLSRSLFAQRIRSGQLRFTKSERRSVMRGAWRARTNGVELHNVRL